ncbi:hypothetical protein D9Q98_002471 [Chlorella vulgaris]|uniref:Uncharacterized protein n=1 Tax=Chlorella vulgaris TaxID=3077 RepID=A0A9D4YZ48_CHLVU|nr:hypothetical protein D9Q98_002471 [Chlorella vulgaris]
MASRCLEGDRGNAHAAMGGTDQAAADTTAECAISELALAVLVPASLLQMNIFSHLERSDKLNLGATCTSLLQASLAWFAEVTAVVQPGKTDVALLAAWLERHQARLHLRIDPGDALQRESSEQERNDSLTALPSSLVTSLTARNPLPAAVSALTALTSLVSEAIIDESLQRDDVPLASLSTHHLRPLMRLRQLRLSFNDLSGIAEELLSLPALAGLQELALCSCKLQAMPRALSALTRLTALNLSRSSVSATASLATLQRLQSLEISYCGLTAAPEQLSALTALTRLDLVYNPLAGGWQHLLALAQLFDLNIGLCGLTALPEQVSALTALTRLVLTGNGNMNGGWHHLLPLTQLQDLDLSWCDLLTVPEQVSALAALNRLNLSRNGWLAGGWQHLLPLTQLQHLDMFVCYFSAVPEQVSALTALTYLNLCWNSPLKGGWQHLLPLRQLQDLNLENCGLTAVPRQLSMLTALTSLNLGLNDELAGGWRRLYQLTSLRRLVLRSFTPQSIAPRLAAMPLLHIET